VGRPTVKIRLPFNDDPQQQHFGMLGAAILRALAMINSSFPGVDPHMVGAVANQVGLLGQSRYRETMIDIR
jgi:hypothetical protein